MDSQIDLSCNIWNRAYMNASIHRKCIRTRVVAIDKYGR